MTAPGMPRHVPMDVEDDDEAASTPHLRQQRRAPGCAFRVIAVIIMFLGLYGFAHGLWHIVSRFRSGHCDVDLGEYRGPEFTSEATVSSKCLLSSPWLSVKQHTVRSEDGSLVPDWLFVEYFDRVNVLAQDADTGDFVVLRQTKYALGGAPSLAVVGGIIEPGEAPGAAAARELAEELGLAAGELVTLGKHRTDVNRGLGWVHAFLATGCRRAEPGPASLAPPSGSGVGGSDAEAQASERLGRRALSAAVREGKFVEVQWSNTVGLALLHLAEASA